MYTCKAIPDSDSYTIVDGTEVITSQVPGGLPRFRRDFVGAPATITVQWTCSLMRYNYLRALFRLTTNGALPFICPLAFDAGILQNYTCYFVPGTFGLSSQDGGTYVVAASLYVVPITPSTDATTESAYPTELAGRPQLALDLVPGACVAYSAQRISSAYYGPLLRAKRVADGFELDIPFDPRTGGLNMAILAAFAGPSAMTIPVLYDQSGNAQNATQATVANQPILSAGGAIQWDGERYMAIPNAKLATDGNEFSVAACANPTNGTFGILCGFGADDGNAAHAIGVGHEVGNTLGLHWPGGGSTGGTAWIGSAIVGGVYTATAQAAWQAGAQLFSSAVAKNIAYGNAWLGCWANVGYVPFQGTMSSFIAFNRVLVASDFAALNVAGALI